MAYKKYKNNLTEYPNKLTGITMLEYRHDLLVMSIENCEVILADKHLLSNNEIKQYTEDLENYKKNLAEVDTQIEQLSRFNIK